jgi:hypothetical protein
MLKAIDKGYLKLDNKDNDESDDEDNEGGLLDTEVEHCG